MASIRWTIGAKEDLREIVDFIGQDSLTYAAAVSGRLVASVDRLERHPHLGRVVPEYSEPSLREIIVGNYRVVYRVKGEVVGVIALVHGSRDLLKLLENRSWNIPE